MSADQDPRRAQIRVVPESARSGRPGAVLWLTLAVGTSLGWVTLGRELRLTPRLDDGGLSAGQAVAVSAVGLALVGALVTAFLLAGARSGRSAVPLSQGAFGRLGLVLPGAGVVVALTLAAFTVGTEAAERAHGLMSFLLGGSADPAEVHGVVVGPLVAGLTAAVVAVLATVLATGSLARVVAAARLLVLLAATSSAVPLTLLLVGDGVSTAPVGRVTAGEAPGTLAVLGGTTVLVAASAGAALALVGADVGRLQPAHSRPGRLALPVLGGLAPAVVLTAVGAGVNLADAGGPGVPGLLSAAPTWTHPFAVLSLGMVALAVGALLLHAAGLAAGALGSGVPPARVSAVLGGLVGVALIVRQLSDSVPPGALAAAITVVSLFGLSWTGVVLTDVRLRTMRPRDPNAPAVATFVSQLDVEGVRWQGLAGWVAGAVVGWAFLPASGTGLPAGPLAGGELGVAGIGWLLAVVVGAGVYGVLDRTRITS